MSSSVPQRSVVTPLARNPNHLDLFVVGFDGGIYSAWWDQNVNNARWNLWFRIGPAWANVPQGSVVTAIARNPDQIDLFVVGHDGGIYSTWWNPADGWETNHNWFRIGPDWANVPTRSEVTAVARNPNQLDLFVVGHNGGIYSTWWNPNDGWEINHNWFRIVGEDCVHLHFKILANPNITVANMLASMRQVYEPAGIRVELITTENLNLPALLDVNVGACVSGSTTAAQNQLFGNRNNAGANDIVVYFVRSVLSTLGTLNGCAAFPAGSPGAVVAQGATTWTLAHEVGHVLGLSHVDDPPPPNPAAPPALLDRLMTGRGTGNITNPPPDLVASEVTTMRDSGLTDSC